MKPKKRKTTYIDDRMKKVAPILGEIKRLHNKYGPIFLTACNGYLNALREQNKAQVAIKEAKVHLQALRQSLGQSGKGKNA